MIDIRLGPYLTLRELGSGGMGTVYLAEVMDRAPGLEIGDRVALKVIHSRLMATPGFFKRFLREGEVGRRIRHENVVATFDVDGTEVSGETVLFIATEYVQGQTLRALLEELGIVPEELCRHIALEIARGLEAIHVEDVVHRDLKPENVLVTGDHVVKVMDLGVARVNEEGGKLSRTGSFVGSVLYAAPEQFIKSSEDIDGRSDLYALGLLLYELATGRHPFQGMKLATLMQAHLAEKPRALDEVEPRVSRFFAEVVGTLLAKDPAERFASASALQRVLTEGEDGDWWRTRAEAIPGGDG